MTDYKLNLFEELSKLSQDYGEHGRALLLTFAEEAHGISGKIEQTLIGSEHDLSTLQRHIHTLKGSAGQAGLVSLGHMLHLIEGLLNPLIKHKDILFEGLAGQLVHLFSSFDDLFIQLTRLDFTNGLSKGSFKTCAQVVNQIELAYRSIARDLVAALERPEDYSMVSTRNTGPTTRTQHPIEGESYRLQKSTLDDMLQWLEKILIELFRRRQDPSLSNSIQTLQQTLLTLVRARTESAAPLAEKLNRLTKETARVLQKSVSLEVSGFQARIDSRLLTLISEALLHLVRNAIDHGLEGPSERTQNGKAAEAKLRITLEYKADRTVVTVADDGRGIDPERVASKAFDKGLISKEDKERFNSYEKQELIFLPGFSTKDEASEISGRGVGMDAVRSAVEEGKGKITVDSHMGEGTTFIMTFASSYIYEPMRILRFSSGLYAISDRFVKGILSANDWSFEFGACIPSNGSGDIYPILALPEIDSRSEQEGGRPVLLLNLGGAVFALACDEVAPESREIFMVPATTQGLTDLPVYVKGGCMEDDLGILQGIDLIEIELSINRYQFGAVKSSLGDVSDVSALRGGGGVISERLGAGYHAEGQTAGPLLLQLELNLRCLSPSEQELMGALVTDCDLLISNADSQGIEAMAGELIELLQDSSSIQLSQPGLEFLHQLSSNFIEYLQEAA